MHAYKHNAMVENVNDCESDEKNVAPDSCTDSNDLQELQLRVGVEVIPAQQIGLVRRLCT